MGQSVHLADYWHDTCVRPPLGELHSCCLEASGRGGRGAAAVFLCLPACLSNHITSSRKSRSKERPSAPRSRLQPRLQHRGEGAGHLQGAHAVPAPGQTCNPLTFKWLSGRACVLCWVLQSVPAVAARVLLLISAVAESRFLPTHSSPGFQSHMFPPCKSRSLFALYYSATGVIVR